jgi:hypothetical protein
VPQSRAFLPPSSGHGVVKSFATTTTSRSTHLLASGSKTAAQPQMQEQAPAMVVPPWSALAVMCVVRARSWSASRTTF